MNIGENIKRCRKALHMTLEEVSARVGVSRQTLCRYETGKITNIPPEKVEALANALQTTPAALMGWTDQLASQLSDDAGSGRTAAKETMYQSFGSDHTTAELRAIGEQIALLYYKAMDRYAAPELLELIRSVEELDRDSIAAIRQVVQGYLSAGRHIREIVDVSLKLQRSTTDGKYQENTGKDGDKL